MAQTKAKSVLLPGENATNLLFLFIFSGFIMLQAVFLIIIYHYLFFLFCIETTIGRKETYRKNPLKSFKNSALP